MTWTRPGGICRRIRWRHKEGRDVREPRNAAGRERARLGVTADEPALNLRDAAGKPRTILTVGADGPTLALFDAARKPRAFLGMLAYRPTLGVYDAAGKTIWRAA